MFLAQKWLQTKPKKIRTLWWWCVFLLFQQSYFQRVRWQCCLVWQDLRNLVCSRPRPQRGVAHQGQWAASTSPNSHSGRWSKWPISDSGAIFLSWKILYLSLFQIKPGSENRFLDMFYPIVKGIQSCGQSCWYYMQSEEFDLNQIHEVVLVEGFRA